MSGTSDVVIPAGGTIDEEYARRIGVPHRALGPIGPRRLPVMQAVVNALRASGRAGRVIGVAPQAVAEAIAGVDLWLPSAGSGAANIVRGLSAAAPDRPALVCMSDLPLITPGAIRDFADRCRDDVDISVGLVGASAYHAAFPGAPPSEFVALRDAGPVTIGCLFRVRPALIQRHGALFDQTFSARKSQWRMASLLGPGLLWRWATRSLTLRALTARAERRLGCRAQIIAEVAPVLSFDIDTVDDYAYADARLGKDPPTDRDPPADAVALVP